jgi:hypothetical protein
MSCYGTGRQVLCTLLMVIQAVLFSLNLLRSEIPGVATDPQEQECRDPESHRWFGMHLNQSSTCLSPTSSSRRIYYRHCRHNLSPGLRLARLALLSSQILDSSFQFPKNISRLGRYNSNKILLNSRRLVFFHHRWISR